ncbi:hypothetical protein GUITHDRAFT_133711 [Guillardia theta CCMP2712]|uniref:Uncharacterized protein n=1 Tax=Guillardia theta (strain CCMP2712) TaxID=905079 RepID=L1JWD7_GUITC|nr:hypothetical protein GUITHDRAFT_133711 [Guillardia theta CCMP2712]EKX52682.1 hypothetical protein GUITHDRAFT_133711 [Guillardia theta CCMP2712]|eukprot:XP_005839662.1 hypothetical protein GUITHDRAFT_133711 [Guillardia theta CCMP2712]
MVRWLVVMTDTLDDAGSSHRLPPSSSSLVTLTHAISSLLHSRASQVTLDVRGLEGLDEFGREGEEVEEKLRSYQVCVVLGCWEIVPWEPHCTSLVCMLRCWLKTSKPLFCEATGAMLVWHVLCAPMRLIPENLVLLEPDEKPAPPLTARSTQSPKFLLQLMTGEILQRVSTGKEHGFVRLGNAGIRRRRHVVEETKRMLAIRAGRAVEQHWLMAKLLRFFPSDNLYKVSTSVRNWYLNVTLGNSERTSCEMSFEAFQGSRFLKKKYMYNNRRFGPYRQDLLIAICACQARRESKSISRRARRNQKDRHITYHNAKTFRWIKAQQQPSCHFYCHQLQARMLDSFFRDNREKYHNPLPISCTSLQGKDLLPADFKSIVQEADMKAAVPKLE